VRLAFFTGKSFTFAELEFLGGLDERGAYFLSAFILDGLGGLGKVKT
jgi:hypothetical protein